MHFVLALIGAVVLFIIAVGLYGSSEITKIPKLATPYTPSDFGLVFEDAVFRSFDGLRLTGWFIPADAPATSTVIVQHGMGSNAGDSLLNALCLRDGGRRNLFFFNFRGHATSDGTWTSLGPLELKDAESALAWLTQTKPAECKQLAIYGHSMGAAVAIVLAARHPELEGVLAESSFSAISKTVGHFSNRFYGIPYFPFIPLALFFTSLRLRHFIGDFAPVDSIGQISPRPVLLIQGERDQRMPMEDATTLFAAAKEPKDLWVVPGADHGEPWIVAREEYERRLIDFFRKVFHENH